MSNFALRIYFGSGDQWVYEDFQNLPVVDPCVIVIHAPAATAAALDKVPGLDLDKARDWLADKAEGKAKPGTGEAKLQRILEQGAEFLSKEVPALRQKLRELVEEIHGQGGGEQTASAQAETRWQDLPPNEIFLLHVVLSDGITPVSFPPDEMRSVRRSDRKWVLPVIPAPSQPITPLLLDAELGKNNAAFWRESLGELAQVILARSGVTSLDRRVFISYRRPETAPMANQLFDELNHRNFEVFLDSVSINPGVNFQANLFEHLADKSMIVLLLSKTFPRSQWTQEEIKFARKRRLSVLILRLPDAPPDRPPGLPRSPDEDEDQYLDEKLYGRSDEMVKLREEDLEMVDVPGLDYQQPRLKKEAVDLVLQEILKRHDKELIARVRNLRERVLSAVRRANLSHDISSNSAAIEVEVNHPTGGTQRYMLYPSAYPPGVPEMHAASVRVADTSDMRVVVGHTANILRLRAKQLRWVVNERNVTYHDIANVRSLLRLIADGELLKKKP